MGRIKVLSEDVARQIAAGEVVERPASVVKELLENAIDASAHRIEINVETAGRKLVEVSDNGPGIPKEDIKRIFERFYRVDKSRSKDRGGIGLGLAIVKHILEAHHQKIWVTSELGKGSSFYFNLVFFYFIVGKLCVEQGSYCCQG